MILFMILTTFLKKHNIARHRLYSMGNFFFRCYQFFPYFEGLVVIELQPNMNSKKKHVLIILPSY